MKRIALDINDTIRDNVGQFCKYYRKVIDPMSEIEPEDVTTFNFEEAFNFEDKDAYLKFRYEECPYELFARAELTEERLPFILNTWVERTLRDFLPENIPSVMFVSPFEMGLTIQATYAFLARVGTRVREFYFPIDSSTIWDRCDILITANPNMIANVPEGKTVIKIEAPYNKDAEAEHTFSSLVALIEDEDETLIKMIED